MEQGGIQLPSPPRFTSRDYSLALPPKWQSKGYQAHRSRSFNVQRLTATTLTFNTQIQFF